MQTVLIPTGTSAKVSMSNISTLFFNLFLVNSLFLSACDQKGVLFIPDEQPVEQTRNQDTDNKE